MNDNVTKLLIFAAGAAIGSAVTWKLLKTKYEIMAQEEIDSCRETFARRYGDTEEDKSISEKAVEMINETPSYEDVLKSEGYTDDEDGELVKEDIYEEEDEDMEPYVISPDEFGDEYPTDTLVLYADGVLTDMFDEPIEDIDGLVGRESLTRFGEYEEDTVYVRNDFEQCDFEIQRDTRNYSDIFPAKED